MATAPNPQGGPIADRLPVPMPRPLRLAAALLIASVAIACQGDNPTETTDPPVATTVTLSATTLGFSSLEDTQQLTPTRSGQ